MNVNALPLPPPVIQDPPAVSQNQYANPVNPVINNQVIAPHNINTSSSQVIPTNTQLNQLHFNPIPMQMQDQEQLELGSQPQSANTSRVEVNVEMHTDSPDK